MLADRLLSKLWHSSVFGGVPDEITPRKFVSARIRLSMIECELRGGGEGVMENWEGGAKIKGEGKWRVVGEEQSPAWGCDQMV